MSLLGALWAGVLPTLFTLVICYLIEKVGVLERYSFAARLPGIMMNVAQVVLSAALAWPLRSLWAMAGVSPLITVPLWTWLSPLGAAGYALQILALVAVADFLAYWRHRAEHKWFWPIHAVHHAPTELHAANNIGHPLQEVLNVLFISVPLSLFEFSGPRAPVAVGYVVVLMSYLIHSPIDAHLGPLRKLVVDNRFHRIHHSLEERHFDKNFSICFSIWDRLFGTAYEPAPGEWPKVGLADVPAPRSLRDYLLLPARLVAAQWHRRRRRSEGARTWLSSGHS